MGLRPDCLALAELRLPRGSRGLYRKLADGGLSTASAVLDLPIEKLSRIVPRRLAQDLHKRCIEDVTDEQDRRKHQHLTRLSEIRHDVELVRRLYEQNGVDLERAVEELLNTPQFGLRARRVTRQRRGEADILAEFPGGELVAVSVTASEAAGKPIGVRKAEEILASGTRHRPRAYMAVGRPRFHEDAVTSAKEVASAGISYKLLPISVLAEMYVQGCEGNLAASQAHKVLLEATGLVILEPPS